MKTIVIAIIFFSACSTAALPQDLIYDHDWAIGSLNSSDNNTYKQLNLRRGKKKIFLNNAPIDSTGLSFGGYIFLQRNSKIYSYKLSTDEKKLIFHSIDGRVIKREVEIDRLFIPENQDLISLAIYAEKDDILYTINPTDWKINELLNIEQFPIAYGASEIIFSPDGNNILVQCGEYVGGGS